MNLKKFIYLLIFFAFFVYLFITIIPSLFSVTTNWKETNVIEKLQQEKDFLNQIIERESSLNGKDFYMNQNEFIKLFSKYYFYVDDETISDYKIKRYNLKRYKDKKMLHYYNNFSLIILKFDPECKVVNTSSIQKSSCIVELDLNTIYEGPNNHKFKAKKYNKTDRYTLVIDSKHDKFLIPDKYLDKKKH